MSKRKPNDFPKSAKSCDIAIMPKRKQPNDFQKAARGFVRFLIDGAKPVDPIVTAPKQGTEAWYRDRVAKQLKGKTEVTTPSGRIDVLTKTEVIEVKQASQWKQALGQVLIYSKSYPNHQPRIHLIGDLKQSKLTQIQQECKQFGVKVTWE